jgi:hypothetical protein
MELAANLFGKIRLEENLGVKKSKVVTLLDNL